jgi:hypothetical protein
MAVQMTIKFIPEGFAECLSGLSGQVEAEARRLASQYEGPGTTTVVVTEQKARFQDSVYGVSRPVTVARVVADAEASADEAENKSLSKAVY